jgi:HAMP domain-containing protein
MFREELMRHIQNKLFLMTAFLSIVPIIVTGTISYYTSANSIKNKLSDYSLVTLEQISLIIDEKVRRIEKYLDIFLTNEQLQNVISEVDFSTPSGRLYEAHGQLDPMIGSLFYNDDSIITAIISMPNEGRYVYKGYLDNQDSITSYDWFKKITEANGDTVWTGIIDNPDLLSDDPSVLSVGRVIKDTTYKSTLKSLGTVILLVSTNIVFDFYQNSVIDSSEILAICDSTGNILSQNEELKLKNIAYYDFGKDILQEEEGFFLKKVDGREMMITFYTSKLNGWKVIRMIPSKYYFREINSIAWMTFGLAVVCLIINYILSYLIVRKLSSPILDISHAMREVGNQNFDISVQVTSDDELGIISQGFNTMVSRIKALFDQVVEEEAQKKQSEHESSPISDQSTFLIQYSWLNPVFGY